MMLKNSFCKQVLHICKRNLWAIALSILGFCLCLPLPVAVLLQQYFDKIGRYQLLTATELTQRGTTLAELLDEAHRYSIRDLQVVLGYENIAVRVGIILMAVLCGVALFRYLHDQRQVDLHHALPVKREQLFATRFTAGIVMVLPILWAVRLLTLLMIAAMGFVNAELLSLFAWSFVTDTVFFLVIFSFVTLCTLLTGNTIIAVLLSIWFAFFVPILTMLVTSLGDMYLSTIRCTSSVLAEWLISRFSPIVQYCVLGFTTNHTVDNNRFVQATGLGTLCLVFTLVAVVHIVLAVVLFRKRKSETAGQSVAFGWCGFPIKLSLCVVAALCGWSLFQSIGGTSAWGVFGLVLCIAIAHAVSEIIIQHDFKAIFSKKLHFGLICVAMLAFVFGLRADVLGLNTRLPNVDSLQGVMLESNANGSIGKANRLSWGLDTALTDPANIDIVMQLAQMGVEQSETPNIDTSTTETTAPESVNSKEYLPEVRIEVDFVPKFGFPSNRVFYIKRTPEVENLINQLRTSEEYQSIANTVLGITDAAEQAKVTDIQVRTADVLYGDRNLATVSGAPVAQLIECLQQDMMDLTMTQRENDVPLMRLDFVYPGQGTMISDVAVYPSYTRTIALIAAETGILPTPLSAEQVESILVYDVAGNNLVWREVDDLESIQRDVADSIQSSNSKEYVLGEDVYVFDENVEPEDIEMMLAENPEMLEKYGYAPDDANILTAKPITITDPADIATLLHGALPETMAEATDTAFRQDPNAEQVSVAAVLANGDYVQLYYPTGAYPANVLGKYID